ncbi:hypothetical protein [Bacillus sp. JCM 19041]
MFRKYQRDGDLVTEYVQWMFDMYKKERNDQKVCMKNRSFIPSRAR